MDKNLKTYTWIIGNLQFSRINILTGSHIWSSLLVNPSASHRTWKNWQKIFIYLFKNVPKIKFEKITSETWTSKFSAVAIFAIDFFVSSIAQCCRIQFLVAGLAGTTLFMVQPIFTGHNFLQDIIWIHIRDYTSFFCLNYI